MTARLGFRPRLALNIFGVFVVAAVALLAIEYGVVSALFDESQSNFVIAVESTGTQTFGASSGPVSEFVSASPLGRGTISVVADTQAATRDDVLGGLLFWSTLTLAAFSSIGSILAWWLAGRPLRRLREVTALAQNLSESDLSERLALGGPQDEIRELGDTFDAMLGRLEAAFDSQTAFVANASHELRTPLAISRTALEVALRRPDVAPGCRDALQRAVRANRRGEALLESLLVLARAQHSQQVRPAQPRSLLSLVEHELDSHSSTAREAGVRVVCGLSAGESVSVDPGLFRLVLSNLLGNAIRYNVPDGTVEITARHHGESHALEVVNSGPPVAEPVEDLLKPFHRGDASRLAANGRSPGSGLGLAIADAAANALGGQLRLTARATGGLRAELLLPRTDPGGIRSTSTTR